MLSMNHNFNEFLHFFFSFFMFYGKNIDSAKCTSSQKNGQNKLIVRLSSPSCLNKN